MRSYDEIINDLYEELKTKGFSYEYKALKNEVSEHLMPTEKIGEVCSVLLKMKTKKEVKTAIGSLIDEFERYAKHWGINSTPSEFYSVEQKKFIIEGNDFVDLKGFYNVIGNLLTTNNEWGKNWNALNDILKGGFIKTEYGEPFILIWRDSGNSENQFQEYHEVIELIKSHEHITLITE